MKNDETLKSKKAIVVVTLTILIVLIGITYASIVYQREGEKENTLTTGTLILELDDSTANGISIDPAIPLTESQGTSQTESYEFILRNTGSAEAQYRISLVDDEEAYIQDQCTENKLPHTLLKTALSKNDEDEQIKFLETEEDGENKGVLDQGTIGSGENIKYNLKLWIDSSADTSIGGTHFHGKVKLEGIVKGRTNYQTGE